jgi:hypothetical protein
MERYFELNSRQNEWDDPDEPGFVRVMVSREQYYRETSGQTKGGAVCLFPSLSFAVLTDSFLGR